MAKKVTCPECQGTSMYTDVSGWFCCSPCSRANGKPFKVERNPKAKPEKVKFTDFKFVNLQLTEGEKADAKLYLQTDFDFSSTVSELLSEGYKIGFTCNLDNETIQCTLSAGYAGMANAGKLLSAYAPSWELAFGMVYYKHSVILEKDWGKAVGDSVGQDKWG